MGVAHHATYPIWFEIGRTELLRDQGGFYGDIEKSGIFFVVVELLVKYKIGRAHV
jgi:acyl-CoA thioester hydrolase